ncbi:MAG: tail fiber protein [Prolixibacteraceae bacterium]
MTDNYLGEIRAFSFNYAPNGWHLCDGAILNIQQNAALFSLIGAAFGGDGKTTFALPDLRGRCMINEGLSPEGTAYLRGNNGGKEAVNLVTAEMPLHTHDMHVENAKGNAGINTNILSIPQVATIPDLQINAYNSDASQNTVLNPDTVSTAGGGAGHNNMQPYLTVNFCIATQGYFPPRP